MKKLTVGADPEFLLYDPVSEKHIPSIGLLGGTKGNPVPMGIGSIQEDNVMGEFCIPPAESANELNAIIQAVIAEIQGRIHGLSMTREAAAYFDPDMLKHPQARHVGCDPDFDAWSIKKNPTPKVANGNLRTCGGHVHVGMPEIVGKTERDKAYDRVYFTRWLDLFLGVPSVLLDKDTLRSQFYGKAGAHRPKPYGVEYRVMSNFWIFNSKLIKWVYNNVQAAYNAYRNFGGNLDDYRGAIEQAINNKDKEFARALIRDFNVPFVRA